MYKRENFKLTTVRDLVLGLCLVFWLDRIGSLDWPMTKFKVRGILVMRPRKQRLYMYIIDNPKLCEGVREVRALSPIVPNHGEQM